jgi:hypothetical protein
MTGKTVMRSVNAYIDTKMEWFLIMIFKVQVSYLSRRTEGEGNDDRQ